MCIRDRGDSLAEQMAAVQTSSNAIADLIEQGHELVITHGNGPQVGLASIESGQMALTMAAESLGEVLQECQSLIAPLAISMARRLL